MALGTRAEQQRAEDMKNARKALCDAQQAFQRTSRMWGLVLVPLTAVTALIDSSAAAVFMGIYYPALQLFITKSLLEGTLKLMECAFDVSIAEVRIKKAEEL